MVYGCLRNSNDDEGVRLFGAFGAKQLLLRHATRSHVTESRQNNLSDFSPIQSQGNGCVPIFRFGG
jgi:hypothetical protein